MKIYNMTTPSSAVHLIKGDISCFRKHSV